MTCIPVETSLKKRSVQGVLWNAFGSYSHKGLQIVVSAILSRLLSPQDYGIMAMVLVLSGFMSIFPEAALIPAIVQHQDLDNKDLSSICWFGLCLGFLMFLIMAGCSPYIALFYKTPILRPVATVMGLTFLFQAPGEIPLALLQRQLNFKSISFIRLISALCAAIVAVYLALTGAGYWALVIQHIVYAACCGLLFFYAAKWLPAFSFQLKSIQKVFRYSTDITSFSAINYWARNADNILIGKFWGSSMLGYYSHAYNLMLAPLCLINQVINPVLHSALARIQENRVQVRVAFLQVVKYISMVCFPLVIVQAFLAPEIVQTLWGKQWSPCIRVFRILSSVGLVQPVVSSTDIVFQACNRTDMLLKIGTINAIAICAGIVSGLSWGMSGVAIGYSIGYGMIVVPTLYAAISVVLGGSLQELFAVVAWPALMAACAGLSLAVWNRLFRGMLPAFFHAAGGGACAGAVSLMVLGIFDRPSLSELSSSIMPSKSEERNDTGTERIYS